MRSWHISLWTNGVVGLIVKVFGPPLTIAVWLPLVAQSSVNQPEARSTGSVKVTERFDPIGMFVSPLAGDVDWTSGAESSAAIAEMSSTPTHSSGPLAFAVMILTWTALWSFAAAGRPTSTGVTRVASFGPVVASATNPAGRFVYVPLAPTRYWTATDWIALAELLSMSRRL